MPIGFQFQVFYITFHLIFLWCVYFHLEHFAVPDVLKCSSSISTIFPTFSIIPDTRYGYRCSFFLRILHFAVFLSRITARRLLSVSSFRKPKVKFIRICTVPPVSNKCALALSNLLGPNEHLIPDWSDIVFRASSNRYQNCFSIFYLNGSTSMCECV